MIPRLKASIVAASTPVLLMLFTGVVSAELTVAEFEKLHLELRPATDAPWRSIPWMTSLLGAQKVAAEQGKPVFIWAMDGHPLGCT